MTPITDDADFDAAWHALRPHRTYDDKLAADRALRSLRRRMETLLDERSRLTDALERLGRGEIDDRDGAAAAFARRVLDAGH
jgi:hypothetical protein